MPNFLQEPDEARYYQDGEQEGDGEGEVIGERVGGVDQDVLDVEHTEERAKEKAGADLGMDDPGDVDLEEGFLRQLAARLDLAGVRTGPSVQNVSCRLDDWANGNSYPREHRVSFVEDLALGDLWS